MTANLSPAMAKFKKNNPTGFASLLVPHTYALSIISEHGIDGESFKSFDNALYWYRELAQYLGKNGKRYYKLDIELYNYYNDILPLTIPQAFQLEAAKWINPTIAKWDHYDVRKKVGEASTRDKPSKGEWCAYVGGVETAKYIEACLGKRLKNVTEEMVANYEQTEKTEAIAQKERIEVERKHDESQKRARMLEWKMAEAKRLAEESRRLAEAAKRCAEEADRLETEDEILCVELGAETSGIGGTAESQKQGQTSEKKCPRGHSNDRFPDAHYCTECGLAMSQRSTDVHIKDIQPPVEKRQNIARLLIDRLEDNCGTPIPKGETGVILDRQVTLSGETRYLVTFPLPKYSPSAKWLSSDEIEVINLSKTVDIAVTVETSKRMPQRV